MKKRPYLYLYIGLGTLGLVGGLLWWNFYGCTDSCPINSSPSLTMLRGTLIGLCAAAIFHPFRPKKTPPPSQDPNT